jgi:hypothetical protein
MGDSRECICLCKQCEVQLHSCSQSEENTADKNLKILPPIAYYSDHNQIKK